MNYLSSVLLNETALAIWLTLVFFSLSFVLAHMHDDNADISMLGKAVWFLVTLFLGPVGLVLYWFGGRKGHYVRGTHVSL